MQTTFWLVLLGLFVSGYLALEGADFGAAMTLPLLGRADEPGRDEVARAIAPFFLGNEVWLVAAIGTVDGVFPSLRVLNRLYPVLIPILVAWVARDMGLWLRRRGGGTWRWRADCVTGAASVVLTMGWGVVLGNLATGPGATFGLVPLLSGLLLTGLCAIHGSAFLTRRATVALAERIPRTLAVPVAAITVATGVAIALTRPPTLHSWPLWLAGALALLAALTPRIRQSALPLTAVTLIAVAPLTALANIPLPPTNQATLSELTPIVLAALPIMAASQLGMWWLTRDKSRTRSYF
jgi:cytochrome bd-type quinol oxidase subunit 2